MSDLNRNMILGAALTTAFTLAVLGVVTPMLFEKAPPAKPGYAIAVAAEAGGEAAPQAPPDWGTVLKTADVSAGEAKTAVCKSCHVFDAAGTNNIGPGLYGVLGRKPGTHPGFAYSPAMIAFGAKTPVWDYEHIFEFIAGPQKYIDGTKMTFIGMKDRQDRINVIAYLHTLGSNLPIPAPNPKAAAPAAAGKAGPAGAPTNSAAPTNAASPTNSAAPTNTAAPAKSGGA
jgi:cytochrome c